LNRDGARSLQNSHWGFVLPQKSKRTGQPIQPKAVNNARADKLRNSPFWRKSFETRRCLVPATSFCEAKGRNPAIYYWFGMKGPEKRPCFAFAGIWMFYKGAYGAEERSLVTSSIVTTTPNGLVADIHPDRMPAILEPEDYETWLTGSPDAAFDLIKPYPADKMVIFQSGEGLKADPGGLDL
ncbi:MAG: SOS response-associated peptidase family protein, partial [Pseudomonadota bacterium]